MKYYASVKVDPKVYLRRADIESLVDKKLRKELENKGCCQIEISEWEFLPQTEEDFPPDYYRKVAVGEECSTAVHWKEKADYWRELAIALSTNSQKA